MRHSFSHITFDPLLNINFCLSFVIIRRLQSEESRKKVLKGAMFSAISCYRYHSKCSYMYVEEVPRCFNH